MIFKRKALLLFTLLALSVTPLLAQEAEKDSLVRLLSAKSAELIKKDGISYARDARRTFSTTIPTSSATRLFGMSMPSILTAWDTYSSPRRGRC